MRTSTTEYEWWEHPMRPCKNRPEYSDPTLIPGSLSERRMVMRDLASYCRRCPVLRECAADDLMHRDADRHGIRAGMIRV